MAEIIDEKKDDNFSKLEKAVTSCDVASVEALLLQCKPEEIVQKFADGSDLGDKLGLGHELPPLSARLAVAVQLAKAGCVGALETVFCWAASRLDLAGLEECWKGNIIDINKPRRLPGAHATALAHAINRSGQLPPFAPLRSVSTTRIDDTLQWLLEHKADANAPGQDGDRPLHFLRARSSVQVLLESKADINAVNNAGDTPLMRATTEGRFFIVVDLLEAGADVEIKNKKGFSPLKPDPDAEPAPLKNPFERGTKPYTTFNPRPWLECRQYIANLVEQRKQAAAALSSTA